MATKTKTYHAEKIKFTCHHGVSHLGQAFCERCLNNAMGRRTRAKKVRQGNTLNEGEKQ